MSVLERLARTMMRPGVEGAKQPFGILSEKRVQDVLIYAIAFGQANGHQLSESNASELEVLEEFEKLLSNQLLNDIFDSTIVGLAERGEPGFELHEIQEDGTTKQVLPKDDKDLS